jgi:serine O-acetyltransferase
MLSLMNSDRQHLLDYLCSQLNQFFPDHAIKIKPQLEPYLDQALARLHNCINAVRLWRLDEFDYLHSTQYAIFLYFLSNTLWKHDVDLRLCTKLFYLNKALNGIDCFYEIELPEIFFIGHTVGIVLAKASYSNYLVLYQNSTVGKNHGMAPTLGQGVVMYPNSAIIGRCHVATGSVIAQGVSVINRDTRSDCLVFQGTEGNLVFQKNKRNILADIFRV